MNSVVFPLVSVVVVAYNSCSTVIETLESIYNQSYSNIELIIADDNSKDSTLLICEEFIKANRSRFFNAKIINSQENMGISVNCNKGCYAASGKWIKIIAGDDVLTPDCIQTFYEHTQKYPEECFIFSDIELFGNMLNPSVEESWRRRVACFYRYKTASQQYLHLTSKGNFVPAPSSFFSSDAFRKVGGFDETIRFIEDHPFWIRVTEAGYKLSYIPVKLVKYRVSDLCVASRAKTRFNITKVLFKQKYQAKNPLFPILAKHVDQFGDENTMLNSVLLRVLAITGLPFFVVRKVFFAVKRLSIVS